MSLPTLRKKPAFVFAPSAPLRDQRRQHRRRGEQRVPRIVRQRVEHRLDDVRHRVEADDVGRAIGGALRAADRRAGQRIDDVEREAECLRVLHRRQHRKDADAVGDEIRRVLRADHALAERRREERLQRVEQRRLGLRRSDQLDQMHVARRIEEMDAAEARAQRCGHRLRQRRERQSRRVGREDGVRRHVRRDLLVEIALPVEALGDRLDDEIAFGESARDRCRSWRRRSHAARSFAPSGAGSSLARPAMALRDQPVRVALLGRKVEQHDRNVGVGEMRGDLRAHDAGAEHGGLADQQAGGGHRRGHRWQGMNETTIPVENLRGRGDRPRRTCTQNRHAKTHAVRRRFRVTAPERRRRFQSWPLERVGSRNAEDRHAGLVLARRAGRIAPCCPRSG